MYNLVLNSKFASKAEPLFQNQYSVIAKLLKITLKIIYGEFNYLKMYQELQKYYISVILVVIIIAFTLFTYWNF